MMKLTLPALTLGAAMIFPFNAMAAPVDWEFSGTGTLSLSTQNNDIAMTYALNPAGYSTVLWTASATVTEAGDYTFDWDYSGHHAWFKATTQLKAFDSSDYLYNYNTQNCCDGFNQTGRYTFENALVGDVIGFSFGGSNFDSNNFLNGTLRLTPVNEVPIPGAAWLFGTSILGLANIARRRKALA